MTDQRPERIRVMLVDDHIFFRRGVRQIVDAEPDMQVVAEAADGQDAVSKAKRARPDIILMDVNMPRMDGVEATRFISAELPEVRIVMLTVSDTDDHLFESIKNGAVGFLLKDVSPEEMTKAIRDTAGGESSLSPFIAARLVRYVQKGGHEAEPRPIANLTQREDEILRLIARGARDREIAQQLIISESTVKKHVQNVLRKLHARNRVEAVSYLDPAERRPPAS
ncbi:MAG TPA: response regulator transcription factor [Chloroflexota bacterium]|nr:response regulator transcription factor [Chloroflexota bacterium]